MATANLKKPKTPAKKTHEGAPAHRITAIKELRRSVLSCMLWEDEFYESGQRIADRIANLCKDCKSNAVLSLAIEAREQQNLRHVPLWLMVNMADHCHGDSSYRETLTRVIQRADELTEFMALWNKSGKRSMPKRVKNGLAKAFCKFDAYQLAKYDKEGKEYRMRDVMFMVHPKPLNEQQTATFKLLAENKLPLPDTWEVSLSAGKDKKETFERLIKGGKLGAMALLRNLRNMEQAKVDRSIIKSALVESDVSRVLPFRFISAARHAMSLEPELEQSMLGSCGSLKKLSGNTIILVDVSGSMDTNLSDKSQVTRIDAACGLSIIAREVCESVRIFTFSNNVVEVPPRRGFALRDAISQSQSHDGTLLGKAVDQVSKMLNKEDRLIVITDEQSHDRVETPTMINKYMINVASYQNGVGYKDWTHIDGWSESILNWIVEYENF